MTSKATDLIDALHRVPEGGKAEIVNGELVLMSPTGSRPGRAAQRIFLRLDAHERNQGGGHAYADNIGFLVDLPNRQSFSPDAAWYVGVIDTMGFLNGAPRLAVEVRSESDYGPAAEKTLAQKRAAPFGAGPRVVGAVDILWEAVVRVHRAGDPDTPPVSRRGDIAEAEPAVPGWRMSVDDLFD